MIGIDKNTDIGAIHSEEQFEKIHRLVQQGCKEGGQLYQKPGSLPSKGYFFPPSFFTKLGAASTVSRVEIFGPVLSIMTFRTPSEAVKKANDTPYGLAAGIWTEKASKLHEVASDLNAGVVWGNTYNQFDPTSPFGGVQESGWGREGGLHGLYSYLEAKE